MTQYTAEQIKWFQNWEKNLDNALKAIKKCKEDMEGSPAMTNTAVNKYHLYVRLLEAEAQEMVEDYEGKYPTKRDEGGLTTE